MARMFRIVVLVLVLWDLQCANGTERTKVTSSTDTMVILGEDKREPEPNEFNPAEYVTGGRKREISSDSFLYYGAFNMLIDGKRLEGVGVEPDIEVPFDIRFTAGKDIQLQRAKDEIVQLIEALQNS